VTSATSRRNILFRRSFRLRPAALIAVAMLICVTPLIGCQASQSYTTPGAAVSLGAITDPDLRAAFQVAPESPFPARLAVARVQASGYHSGYGRGARYAYGRGSGRYTVVTTRDVESDAEIARIARLAGIAAVAPVGRILMPDVFETARDLRLPASQLRADLLLLYSIDTTFVVDGTPLGPLSLVSLGFIPNRTAHVTATTACALIDVRTGFVYGVAEATATEQQGHSRWSRQQAIDSARTAAERESFTLLLTEFETLWRDVVAEHFDRR